MAKVKSGLERLEKQRFPNGAYPYDERRERAHRGMNRFKEVSGESASANWLDILGTRSTISN